MDDIDDIMDDYSDLNEKTESAVKKEEADDDFDYWGDPEVTAMSIDVDTFSVTKPKSFTVVYSGMNTTLPDDIKLKYSKLAGYLSKKHYTYRHNAGGEDILGNTILSTEDLNVQSFLPWKNFNKNIKKPVIKKCSGKAYKLAAGCHKAFKKLPNAVRAILASNVHSMLGKDCDVPTTMLIVYTSCGSEKLPQKLDYKVLGNVAFFLKVAEESNIPVFNLQKEDAVSRLINYVKKQEEGE